MRWNEASPVDSGRGSPILSLAVIAVITGAPELLPTVIICGPIAWALHEEES